MADLNLDASQPLNITMRYNDTMKFDINAKNSDSSDYDFANCTAVFEIRKTVSESTPFVSFDTTSGIILNTGKISISKTLPTTLVPGKYSYTFQITDNGIVSTWLSGILNIKQDA